VVVSSRVLFFFFRHRSLHGLTGGWGALVPLQNTFKEKAAAANAEASSLARELKKAAALLESNTKKAENATAAAAAAAAAAAEAAVARSLDEKAEKNDDADEVLPPSPLLSRLARFGVFVVKSSTLLSRGFGHTCRWRLQRGCKSREPLRTSDRTLS
jgi:hypothetical protein